MTQWGKWGILAGFTLAVVALYVGGFTEARTAASALWLLALLVLAASIVLLAIAAARRRLEVD